MTAFTVLRIMRLDTHFPQAGACLRPLCPVGIAVLSPSKLGSLIKKLLGLLSKLHMIHQPRRFTCVSIGMYVSRPVAELGSFHLRLHERCEAVAGLALVCKSMQEPRSCLVCCVIGRKRTRFPLTLLQAACPRRLLRITRLIRAVRFMPIFRDVAASLGG